MHFFFSFPVALNIGAELFSGNLFALTTDCHSRLKISLHRQTLVKICHANMKHETEFLLFLWTHGWAIRESVFHILHPGWYVRVAFWTKRACPAFCEGFSDTSQERQLRPAYTLRTLYWLLSSCTSSALFIKCLIKVVTWVRLPATTPSSLNIYSLCKARPRPTERFKTMV